MRNYLLLLILVPSMLRGQRQHLDRADEFFRQHFYLEAIAEYKLALQEDVVINKFYMTQQIARTYKELFDYRNAEEWYRKLIALGDENEAINYLHYAQILANNEKYQESESAYALYAQKSGKAAESDNWKELAGWAIDRTDSIERMSIHETNLETGSRSMGIWLYNDYLYFAQPGIEDFTQRTAFYDLSKVALKDSVTVGAPLKLGEMLNRSFYEGTPCIFNDGLELLYTANASEKTRYRNEKKNSKAGLSSKGVNALNIYWTKQSGDGWTTPVALNFNSLDYSCAFPSVSNDGKTLHFASNMPGGHGGFDLYKAERMNDSTWSTPVNLGKRINTWADEMYPFSTDTAFYYSTRGLPGFGGADIFRCDVSGASLADPVNMGRPINSSKDDFSFILKPDEHGLMKGYLSSNRKGEHGYDRVFYFTQIPKPLLPDTILAKVVNRITGQPIEGVAVNLERYSGAQILPDSGGYTSRRGETTFILDKMVAYKVTFRADGFRPFVVEIPADDHFDALAKFGRIIMEPEAVKNTVIKIPNIYFDYDKASIRPESFPVLEQIVGYLNENPTIKVELSAHTDSRGSDSYNLRLSDRRAKSVVSYLIDKGIAKERLIGKGYGETKLVNDCRNGVKCEEELHEMNRRVELKVL